jgi:hypothetical protein
MNKNIGNTDRIIRIVVGVALIIAALSGWIGIWGWLGIVPLATAIFSFCPLYALLGMSSTHGFPNHKADA